MNTGSTGYMKEQSMKKAEVNSGLYLAEIATLINKTGNFYQISGIFAGNMP